MRAAHADGNDHTLVERHDPLIGAVLDDRFRIEFQLAAGGFGAIYRATDVRSDAVVALKVLHAQLARDRMVVARFRREGKTLASLRDPHTITAYEVGEAADGTMYIVLELLHGETLYQRFRAAGRLAWQRVVHIALGVCSSLAEAHALGIIHRDLKPANIHLEERDGDPDFVKVLDFGIAKIVHGNGGERTELTQAGQMIGTVDYMSPEQLVGGEMTAASDIYTLGVVIYELIAGRTPFAHAPNATALLAAVLTSSPEPLSTHAVVPAALDQVVARCLEREPANRFAEVSELVEALGAVVARASRAAIVATELPAFDPGGSTTEATRIDVRVRESSAPVLDARGPRRRPVDPRAGSPQLVTPFPTFADGRPSPFVPAPRTATPAAPAMAGPPRAPQAAGSQNAIDARPFAPTPPAAYPPAAAPVAAHAPPPMAHAWPQQQAYPVYVAPPVVEPAARPQRALTYQPPRFDMTAAASHDAMVRRLVWLAVAVVLAVIAFAVLR
jgi:eukaryotic-like serine/threonine-protein kinase